MPARARPSRTQLWLEGAEDWSWPGQGRGPIELSLPSWIPTLPPRLAPAAAGVAIPSGAGAEPQRARRLLTALALGALTLACIAAALDTTGAIERLAGMSAPARTPARSGTVAPAPDLLPPLPSVLPVSRDAAGSSIELASFASASLGGEGAFFVYLPPGYVGGTRRYPVLYLLHGRDGHAAAFLEIGIQRTLDRLIDRRAIPPMIAVMVQDLPGLNNWRDLGRRHSETYVVEVQELVDRMLRTVPERSARAIAGSSMGGFGAMNVALTNPLRFAVVESWLGYFNNLQGQLRADRRVIARLGLHAFLYGAVADPVAVPAEDPEFAARLRAVGARAQSAIYPGGHTLRKVEEHLETGLLFAGRSLQRARRRAEMEAAKAHAAA
jgi:enterochelin esterase-like enzyme